MASGIDTPNEWIHPSGRYAIPTDAHELYAPFGFTPLRLPERFMERHDPDVYARGSASPATPELES